MSEKNGGRTIPGLPEGARVASLEEVRAKAHKAVKMPNADFWVIIRRLPVVRWLELNHANPKLPGQETWKQEEFAQKRAEALAAMSPEQYLEYQKGSAAFMRGIVESCVVEPRFGPDDFTEMLEADMDALSMEILTFSGIIPPKEAREAPSVPAVGASA